MEKTFKKIAYIYTKLSKTYGNCPSVEIVDAIDVTSLKPGSAWMLTVTVSNNLVIQILQVEPRADSAIKVIFEKADAFGMQVDKGISSFASPVDAVKAICNLIDLRRLENHAGKRRRKTK